MASEAKRKCVLLVLVLEFLYLSCNATTASQRPERTLVTIVDLTHELNEDNPNWPTQPSGLVRNETIGGGSPSDNGRRPGFYFKVERICLPSHLGTSLDAPCHYSRNGWCITDIPLERLVLVPICVIDIRHKVFPPSEGSFQPDTQLTVQDILNWETVYGKIPDESVLLVSTGWERFWNDDTLYRGTSSRDPENHRFPGLSPKAAQWLLDNRSGFYGIGIDTISIDYGKTKDFATHTLLNSANKYILENLMNLHRLPPTGALLNIGAMKLGRGASGVPARVIATFYSTNNPKTVKKQ